jgi:hypothetical protein
MEYRTENPPITINGKKTARLSLMKHIDETEIQPRLIEFRINLPLAYAVLGNLDSVWDWKPTTRPTFWEIFSYLLDSLVAFWRVYPPDNATPDIDQPSTWNADTWYDANLISLPFSKLTLDPCRINCITMIMGRLEPDIASLESCWFMKGRVTFDQRQNVILRPLIKV